MKNRITRKFKSVGTHVLGDGSYVNSEILYFDLPEHIDISPSVGDVISYEPKLLERQGKIKLISYIINEDTKSFKLEDLILPSENERDFEFQITTLIQDGWKKLKK